MKLRLLKKRSAKAGLPPGSLVHIGEEKPLKPKITVLHYNEEGYQEIEVEDIGQYLSLKDTPDVTWINVEGISQVETIEKIGQHFSLHPLLLEDIMNSDQRPKMEDYDDYLFVVLKKIYFDENDITIHAEQISMVLGSSFVITFHEHEGSVFDPVRLRLKNGKGRIRKMGADYLIYSLMDIVVDNYFTVLETLGEKMEDLEVQLVTNPGTGTLRTMQTLKGNMIYLRKVVWPLREVLSSMERDRSPLIHDSTHVYLRDVYDHSIHIMDTIETFRDMLAAMLDIYLSSISNRMNEVMKVLTIIATIFIPLTFIVGLYGMNFEYMPELKLRWGYPAILLVMLALCVFMILYFKRKKWF
ncbi:MAG: magnesium/cobalt transporter CorA [Syntrophorhabdaceae bacterium]|nr:magnesium/cobalt transporter CorA [Syntrophorhabdaceae bacterium]MDD5245123.1 magnesium/cobalt transporter CorA [Syntrophorhabdaceae bacterium]